MVKEARKLRILNDILDHEVIGPEIKKGIQMGELKIQAKLKSGSVLFRTEGRAASEALGEEFEELSVRLVDAKSIESLLK